MRQAGKETEIKLRVADPAVVRRRLHRAGFRVVQRRSLERNTLFDTPERALRRRSSMLRLRSVGGRHWLTFKRPGGASRRYKVRQEFETEIGEARVAQAILEGLGFEPWFRYEKRRTVYAGRGRWRGGEVMLDETPMGNFVELEGTRRWIRQVAEALFRAGPHDFITENYAALYADWCRQRGRPIGDMLFGRRFSA